VILVVDMNCKKDSLAYYEFVLPITSIVEKITECEVKHYLEMSTNDLKRKDKIILSGTPLMDNATLSQPDKFHWLKVTTKPVLGICAGMQTIGLVFGLQLSRCLQIGMTEVITVKENALFSGVFKAYTLHNFSVPDSTKFEPLARSATCTQAIKHRQRPLYGVLFHPEVRNPEIIKRFIQIDSCN